MRLALAPLEIQFEGCRAGRKAQQIRRYCEHRICKYDKAMHPIIGFIEVPTIEYCP